MLNVCASIKCNYCLSPVLNVSMFLFFLFLFLSFLFMAAIKTKWQDEKNQLLISNLWLKLVNFKIDKKKIINKINISIGFSIEWSNLQSLFDVCSLFQFSHSKWFCRFSWMYRNGTIWIWDGIPVNMVVLKICVFHRIVYGNRVCIQ